jgi:hypothetical protein
MILPQNTQINDKAKLKENKEPPEATKRKGLTLRRCVISLSSENLILLKGPSSPLNNLLDNENVDLKSQFTSLARIR